MVRTKIDGNIRQDRTKDVALAVLGWDVVHVWEHENPEAAADRIEDLWQKKTLRPRAAPE
jgi:DNA mismatch endonuclease (patch repair protein)